LAATMPHSCAAMPIRASHGGRTDRAGRPDPASGRRTSGS
jgi:hypothetical protein